MQLGDLLHTTDSAITIFIHLERLRRSSARPPYIFYKEIESCKTNLKACKITLKSTYKRPAKILIRTSWNCGQIWSSSWNSGVFLVNEKERIHGFRIVGGLAGAVLDFNFVRSEQFELKQNCKIHEKDNIFC